MTSGSPTDPFEEIDISNWTPDANEPLGTKPKMWLVNPVDDQLWLFKSTTSNRRSDQTQYAKGDDWAERAVTEVAVSLGLPVATAELCFVDSGDELAFGVISKKVLSSEESLIHGNELLAEIGVAGKSPKDRTGYTLDAVRTVLADVAPPTDNLSFDAWEWFVGYLVLDAIVANTDRHQENWAVIDCDGRRLSPTFDHASSLGFQLADEDRAERLRTADTNRAVPAFASRAQSKFQGTPHPVDLAHQALRMVSAEVRDHWLEQCSGVDSLEPILERVPARRMSPVAREFAQAMFEANLSRTLSYPSGTVKS